MAPQLFEGLRKALTEINEAELLAGMGAPPAPPGGLFEEPEWLRDRP